MDTKSIIELLSLVNKYCSWAVIEKVKSAVPQTVYWQELLDQHKSPTLKFRFGMSEPGHEQSPTVSEWNLIKAFQLMESMDTGFLHRVKSHRCTPVDVDEWLQIAVFDSIVLKG